MWQFFWVKNLCHAVTQQVRVAASKSKGRARDYETWLSDEKNALFKN
jgi:hypothetical protein